MFSTKTKKIIALFSFLGGLAFIFFISFLIWFLVSLGPVNLNPKKEIALEVSKGMALNKVLEDLENQKLIKSAKAGKILAFLKGYSLKMGYYALDSSMGLKEILLIFHLGKEQTIKITFPEGLYAQEYANILKKQGLVSQAQEFLEEVKNPDFLKQHAIPFNSADGFLFPSTYYFPKSFTGAQIAKKMVSVFFEKFKKDLEPLSVQEQKNVLILASIVEKEAVAHEERPIIASVFYNRIQRNMQLESCATVIYAFEQRGVRKKRLLYKDLNIVSPYNTYKNLGLPPAPICNPSEKSFYAALNPAKTSYLYFVYQGQGSHIFSTNLKDHMAAYRKHILYQNKRKD